MRLNFLFVFLVAALFFVRGALSTSMEQRSGAEKAMAMQKASDDVAETPLISIVIPTYNRYERQTKKKKKKKKKKKVRIFIVL